MNKIGFGILRVLILMAPAGILVLPMLFVKVDMIGSPVAIMFTNIIIPFALFSFWAVGGPFDFVLHKLFPSGSTEDVMTIE